MSNDEPVTYRQQGRVAVVTMNRPRYRNAQNSAMTYALNSAFDRAAYDDDIATIVLAGAGPHFSAGHDIGSPGRDVDTSFPRTSLWWNHVGKEGADARLAREEEVYIGMCRRWRELPKPVVGMVQGGCIGGGLMLAWICDLLVAADDAFFMDPVLRMGIPGVEYFAHPWEVGPRVAKEMLFLGERIDARRAHTLGMVARVVANDELEAIALSIAERIAELPRLGLALTKKAINQAEDAMGLRAGMDAAFGLHQLAHAHNAETTGNPLLNQTPETMRSPDE